MSMGDESENTKAFVILYRAHLITIMSIWSRWPPGDKWRHRDTKNLHDVSALSHGMLALAISGLLGLQYMIQCRQCQRPCESNDEAWGSGL